MLRATLLVERIVAGTKLLETNRRLLIVGAGAAGVAAAIRASELHVDCLLLEKEPWALGAQSDSNRIVDPTEYDWPQPHWRKGRFVAGRFDQDLPLTFERGEAQDLCHRWQRLFAAWVGNHTGSSATGNVEIRHRRDLVTLAGADLRFECWEEQNNPAKRRKECDVVIADDGVEMVYVNSNHAPDRFGAIISCIGFGSETVSVPISGATTPYQGPRFWQADSLAERAMGLAKPQGLIRVLVSGGGDGALQDIQRALTRRCGRDLWDRIVEVDPDFEKKIDFAMAAMVDDEGRRAHAWKAPDQASPRSLRKWHRAYSLIARRIWANWSESQRETLRHTVLRETVTVHLFWAVGGLVPAYAFGLNRLLTYLVLLLHQENTGRPFWGSDPATWASDRPIVLAGHRVSRVMPIGHSCTDHRSCNGQLHKVYCNGSVSKEYLVGEFEVVIIRHGAPPRPLIDRPLVTEQFVPFKFPT
jgi:hypothetical protein